jgi:hypothetical protein
MEQQQQWTEKFSDDDVLEGKVNGRWIVFPEWTWRSWTGERKLNGEPFNGPVFFLGEDRVSRS